jgi:hypothetical protein
MKALCSQESQDSMALRRLVSWCIFLATLIVLVAGISAKYHWLTRWGSIAVVLLSIANLFLLHSGESQRPQSTNDESKARASIPGNDGGAAQ